MPKKSRIIVNNWSSASDADALTVVTVSIKDGKDAAGRYPTRWYRHGDDSLIVAHFPNKSSDSFDVRDVAGESKGWNDSE